MSMRKIAGKSFHVTSTSAGHAPMTPSIWIEAALNRIFFGVNGRSPIGELTFITFSIHSELIRDEVIGNLKSVVSAFHFNGLYKRDALIAVEERADNVPVWSW
jgi:hypothetical protein